MQKNSFQKFAANQSGERVGGIFLFLELWGDYETICVVPRQGSQQLHWKASQANFLPKLNSNNTRSLYHHHDNTTTNIDVTGTRN